MAWIGRKFKKYAKKARGKVIKRYFNKGYRPKIGQIIKDVSKVKKMLNAEKKDLTVTQTLIPVGQINVNATGAVFRDITPIIGQGSQANQRTGDSVKLCSAWLQFNFIEQGNYSGVGKYKIEIIKVMGSPQTTGTLSSQYYVADPISGVIDINSRRYQEYFYQYKTVARRTFSMKSNYGGDVLNKTVTIKLRLNHHIHYITGTNSVGDGQYMLVITADNGNCGTSNSTLNAGTVPGTIGNSGFYLNTNFVWYYYDN